MKTPVKIQTTAKKLKINYFDLTHDNFDSFSCYHIKIKFLLNTNLLIIHTNIINIIIAWAF